MPDPAFPKAHLHPFKQAGKRAGLARDEKQTPEHIGAASAYVELAVTSNFSFLTGASHPDELVGQAKALGHAGIALTDGNTLAGIVRGHVAAKEAGISFVVGTRLRLVEPAGVSLFVYPTDRAAYGRLCRLLTAGKRRAAKGECHLWLEDVEAHAEGLLAVVLFESRGEEKTTGENGAGRNDAEMVKRLAGMFDGDRLSVGITRHGRADDEERVETAVRLARRARVPLVAINDVHYHIPQRRALQDVLTCVRHGCSLAEAGFLLWPNAERHLKSAEEMGRLFADYPGAIERTVEIARRAAGFSLDQLKYEYPHEICPAGVGPMEHLRELTWRGAAERYPEGVPEKVRQQVEHEFTLIEELDYAPYFLTVHDLVAFARSRGILCQGRGAAANSAVCYCLGVTAVNPDRINVLFERFVSRERAEPPDIDIDFEHERREEVIQYIYEKYGRERAGLTAEVITYRSRSAVRDVGKAMGLSLDAVDSIAKRVHDFPEELLSGEKLAALGFDHTDVTLRLFLRLAHLIGGFPRHLSQHVGGFVISRGPLCELVPIENAAMELRTIIEWDKDDIDALGILKVDVLGLGMLTCIRKALEMIEGHHGRALNLATIPAEDPHVYDMICAADTVGVFQIESRAQMTMLPRLRPRNFYDLVIEVAIVRPGPIVGDMVHPFLRRRNGEEPIVYPDERIERVLGRTLGIPLFQEQAMALAVTAAGFTPGEAEMLRRAINSWKSRDTDAMSRQRERFLQGMLTNGYTTEFAEQCFSRLQGFGEYGFPESHSASFALLVYASAWIKAYYPAAFGAALLNSQPMGFYAPAQIVRDARDHGVEVRAIDVNESAWDCTLEHKDDESGAAMALRLGLRMVKGLREAEARQIAETVRRRAAEGRGGFRSIIDLWRASGVSAKALHTLALADAFGSMGLDRQQALWAVQSLRGKPLPLFDDAEQPPVAQGRIEVLPAVSLPREVVRDYRVTGLSLKAHPLSFIREALTERRILTAAQIRDEKYCPHGRMAAVAGLVLFRQRPSTAKAVMFMTIEDETGRADLIVRPAVYKQYPAASIYSPIVIARGRVERACGVVHVLARRIEELPRELLELPAMSRDFH